MNLLNLIADKYEREARLYPALLLVFTPVITAIVLTASAGRVWEPLVAVFLGCGGTYLLAQLARDAGKAQEKYLFESWGGMPSIAILRHRDNRLDIITKHRYHKLLESFVTGASAPTVQQEQANPEVADLVYTAWSNYLRTNTRDTAKYALLFRENVSYGYRRNVWGIRIWGIAVSLLSVVVLVGRIGFLLVSGSVVSPLLWGGLVAALFFLLLWVLRFNAQWVRVPADAYAERLVEVLDTLRRGGVS